MKVAEKMEMPENRAVKILAEQQGRLSPGRIVFRFPAFCEYLSIIRCSIQGISDRMGFEPEDVDDLKSAVTEVCMNAIKHAYSTEGMFEIELECNLQPDHLKIDVKDFGKGFNHHATLLKLQGGYFQKELDVKENGLYMVMQLVDELKFSENIPQGTVVTLFKFLDGRGE